MASLFRLSRLGAGLAIVGGCVAIAAGFGAESAKASNCTTAGATGIFLELGLVNNCNFNTVLQGSASYELTSSTSASGGVAVRGQHTSSTGLTPAVLGETSSTADNAIGVQGTVVPSQPGSSSVAVRGVNDGLGVFGIGVEGAHLGAGWGGYFHTTSSGFGAYGTAGAGGTGVVGESRPSTSTGYGVYGLADTSGANSAGVYGAIDSAAANAAGVRGTNSGACCGMGVAGFHSGSGIGVYGEAQSGFAVSGFSPNNWSGYFQGDVRVVGTLTKSAGAFRIDNPIDPAQSYLQHSFVESPDMKNVYDGVVQTNGKGFATVKLPAWFGALNRDFRYQLTSLSGLQLVAVAKEISHNRFTIQSEKPNAKVSWQVTGIRKDPYANAHRIQTVVPKTGAADDKYVHPELYGKPMSKSVVVLPGMTQNTRPRVKAIIPHR